MLTRRFDQAVLYAIELHRAQMRKATSIPYVTHLLKVSLADKLHNARSILIDLRADGEAVWDRFNAGRTDQAWYYGELSAVFVRRLPGSRNLPEFRQVVGELFGG